jgi:tetratricopeptide (TPR) repeat protein
MRHWVVIGVIVGMTQFADAKQYCAFGTCGEVGTLSINSNSPSSNTRESGGSSSGTSSPREPPPVDQATVITSRDRLVVNAAKAFNAADAAFKAQKYDKAIDEYRKAAESYQRLGDDNHHVGALQGVAVAEHAKAFDLLKTAVKNFKKGKLLSEARTLLADAVRNDPDNDDLKRDLDVALGVSAGWCLTPPLAPQANTTSNEFGFTDTSEAICQRKVVIGNALGCDWAPKFEDGRCIVSW